MSKILVVEDEKNISDLITDTLHFANYDVICSDNGIDAVNKINENIFDLIIMDIMLPELNGFEVLEKANIKDTPVIFLSAKNDIPTIIKGLKTGIDYMTKPFEPLELLARIELRIKDKPSILKYKDIIVDLNTHVVSLNDEEILLSPKEYELFVYFLNNLDSVIDRDSLLNDIWGINTEIETRTLDYHIGELRKKLNLKEELITIHGVGYRLKGGKNEI